MKLAWVCVRAVLGPSQPGPIQKIETTGVSVTFHPYNAATVGSSAGVLTKAMVLRRPVWPQILECNVTEIPYNCADCQHHRVIQDPDPDDWFNDDDVAVVCTLEEKNTVKHSRRASERQDRRLVTAACRPYNVKKESTRPDWCPLVKIREAVKSPIRGQK